MSVHLTLGEAAQQVTVTKSTLHRAINDGRLSATRDEHGHYQIDPAELFRVFEPVPRNTDRDEAEHPMEHSGTPVDTADNESQQWFQQQIVQLQQEKSELKKEVLEQDERLIELRQAMAALPSPEQHQAELDRLAQEHQDQIEKQKKQHAQKLAQQQLEQAKVVAEQKQQAEQWKINLEKRQHEIQAARAEAESLKQRATADIARIERRAASERAVREALEQRGLIDRILNRKPRMAEG